MPLLDQLISSAGSCPVLLTQNLLSLKSYNVWPYKINFNPGYFRGAVYKASSGLNSTSGVTTHLWHLRDMAAHEYIQHNLHAVIYFKCRAGS